MSKKTDTPSLSPKVDKALAKVGLIRMGDKLPDDNDEKIESRKRAFYQRQKSGFSQLSLVRGPDGALRWHEGAVRSRHGGRRRAGRAAIPAGRIEKQYLFKKLHDPNQVAAAVQKLDNVMTDPDKRDLYSLSSEGELDWQFADKVTPNEAGQFAGKKILLFIHGTFSHCDGICEQIVEAGTKKNRFGSKFLTDANKRYDLVLAFNHPTLAVSPMVNAFRLATRLRDAAGEPESVDVVCHSRGGLVARWWLEGFASPGTTYRVMFVASPLGGTSLASPARLKSGMDFLSNVSTALGRGAGLTAIPFIQVAGGILTVIGSITKLVAKTPALDAALAAIPGLMGQSRVSTNFELDSLRESGGWEARRQDYFAVRSNFTPPKADKWKFWSAFCKPKEYLMGWADEALDDLVFVERPSEHAAPEAVPNDLVVNYGSMDELSDKARIDNVFDFGRSSKVHHTNYFEQQKTLDFIRESFGIPEA